jgi:hypothetical protein
MYSGEYDACDVTLSVYPHRASLKNMPVTTVGIDTEKKHRKKSWLLDYIDIEGTRFCSEISHTRTDQTA